MNQEIYDKYISQGFRVDDLMTNGLYIIQHPEKYCFTTDAVILANFANVKRSNKVLDLCSGSGIIALLLVGKYNAKSATCVEIQQNLAAMCAATCELNNLSDRIKTVNAPIQEVAGRFEKHSFDTVVCNPPYSRKTCGEPNSDLEIAMCRHEIALKLSDVIKCAADMVKFGGKICIIHQAERIAEIFVLMDANGVKPKRMRLVEGKEGQGATLVMVEGVYGGRDGIKVLKNLVLYDRHGKETDELKQIYARRQDNTTDII